MTFNQWTLMAFGWEQSMHPMWTICYVDSPTVIKPSKYMHRRASAELTCQLSWFLVWRSATPWTHTWIDSLFYQITAQQDTNCKVKQKRVCSSAHGSMARTGLMWCSRELNNCPDCSFALELIQSTISRSIHASFKCLHTWEENNLSHMNLNRITVVSTRNVFPDCFKLFIDMMTLCHCVVNKVEPQPPIGTNYLHEQTLSKKLLRAEQ